MKNDKKSYINYILALSLSLTAGILMIILPGEVLSATKYGIDLWLNNVLPALLPFFVCAKIMTRLGVSKLIGRLLEPVMRPIFRVPGEASFVFAVSITSGYPIGTKLISEMRRQKIITKNEAERMLSFCSTSGPLFILGAVGVGMFGNTSLGWSILISHFLGAILNGLLFRFYGTPGHSHPKRKSFTMVFKEAKEESRGSQPFIIFLGEAIFDSFKTLLLICGYIVLFSIIIALFEKYSLFVLFTKIFFLENQQKLFSSLFQGFFEMTVGCSAVSQIQNISFIYSSLICSAIVSWGGLSTLAQALTFISQTDIHKGLYTVSKISHALCAFFCAFFIAPLMLKYQNAVSHVFNIPNTIISSSFSYKLLFSTKLMLLVIFLFIITAILSQFMEK